MGVPNTHLLVGYLRNHQGKNAERCTLIASSMLTYIFVVLTSNHIIVTVNVS